MNKSSSSSSSSSIIRIILALDIGSSSIRCTAYRVIDDVNDNDNDNDNVNEQQYETIPNIESINGCSSTRLFKCIEPITGKINLYNNNNMNTNTCTSEEENNNDDDDDNNDSLSDDDDENKNENTSYKKNNSHNSHNNNKKISSSLLDEIDYCIDDELKRLKKVFCTCHNNTSNNNQQKNSNYKIIGLGITSFVMNLIGIDIEGEIVVNVNNNVNNNMGSSINASCSYACNSNDVKEECKKLHKKLGSKEKLNELYQRTGTPVIHSSYALPQLCSFYNNENNNHDNNSHNHNDNSHNNSHNNNNNNKVFMWQTISSLCLSRWIGYDYLPISYSEASWTGLFNYHTCKWDDEIIKLLPNKHCVKDALPNVVDWYGNGTNNDNNNENDNNDNNLLKGGIPQYPKCITDNDDNNNTNDNLSTSSTKVNPYWDRWPELRGSDNNDNDNNENDDNDNDNYCQLFYGIGDGICANIGSKCSTSGSRIAVTIGTSAAARMCIPLEIKKNEETNVDYNNNKSSEKSEDNNNNIDNIDNKNNIHIPYGLFCYRIDKYHVLLGGALTDGGSIIEYYRNLFNLTNNDDFMGNKCMNIIKNDYYNDILNLNNNNKTNNSNSNTLTMIPFLGGERSIGWRDGTNGIIYGLTHNTKSYHFIREGLESIVIRLHVIINLLCDYYVCNTNNDNNNDDSNNSNSNSNDTNNSNRTTRTTRRTRPHNIVASGAALEKNDLWRQMIADCNNMVVYHLPIKECTSRGCARMVAMAIQMKKKKNNKKNKNKNLKVVDSRMYLNHEEVFTTQSTISEPNNNGNGNNGYWKNKSNNHEKLLNAISPLW